MLTNDICPTCGGPATEIAHWTQSQHTTFQTLVTPKRLAALERERNRVLRETLVLARKKLFSVSEGAIPTGIDRALKQIDRALAAARDDGVAGECLTRRLIAALRQERERVKVLEEVLKSAKELMPFMPVGYGGIILSNLRHSIATLEEQKP